MLCNCVIETISGIWDDIRLVHGTGAHILFVLTAGQTCQQTCSSMGQVNIQDILVPALRVTTKSGN